MKRLYIFLCLILFIIIQWISIQIFSPNNASYKNKLFISSNKLENEEENVVLIYNRIPKTASTSFMHLPYELCEENDYNVLLLNISNPHSMTWQDRMYFARNVSHWNEKLPALYHGHFAYFDVENLPVQTGNTKFIHINIVRLVLFDQQSLELS